ncbi:hypothetical protein KQX66_25540 [Paenibacillus sp. SM 69]|nr:hypothetical protein [Paenibacillus oleatilyticus]
MAAIQLDLFDDVHPVPVSTVAPGNPVLNGFYYESSTDKFVSFAQGRRYYEEPAKGCGHLKEWQERIKKERAI